MHTRKRPAADPRCAIIGAGMSGLTCAGILARHGFEVVVFDKARRPSGRMSTRRADGDVTYDHGAQYFTVRQSAFTRAVEGWLADGVVARWEGRIVALGGAHPRPHLPTTRYVGTPTMSAICGHLARGLDVRLSTKIERVERRGSQWVLTAEDGEHDGFDTVVVAVPAGQAAALLAASPDQARIAAACPMAPSWAVMVVPEQRIDVPFDGAFVHRSPLQWAARQASKPGRVERDAWVLHASASWTREHWEKRDTDVISTLSRAFAEATGLESFALAEATAHRWRYALPTAPLEDPCLFDVGTGLGACGDWCGGPRVEGAFMSGAAVADRIVNTLR